VLNHIDIVHKSQVYSTYATPHVWFARKVVALNNASQTGFDEQAIRKTVRQCIAELAPNQNINELKAEHKLVEDLEYHSLALMEMAFTLEDEFHLDPISESDAQSIRTAGDVEEYVVNELRRKQGG
jgi:acyl carrier protein